VDTGVHHTVAVAVVDTVATMAPHEAVAAATEVATVAAVEEEDRTARTRCGMIAQTLVTCG
jgi:hypothetical protein